MNFDQLITATDTEVTVWASKIGAKFSNLDKELLYDFFATKYNGQKIIIPAVDGENLKERGIFDFFESICKHNLVTREQIQFKTHDHQFPENFGHEKLPHTIFWAFWLECKVIDFPPVADDAVFVGLSIGRFTPTRVRLAYEVNQAFGTNAYIIFQPRLGDIQDFYSQTGDLYQKELDWITTHTFKKDGNLHEWMQAGRGWQESCQTYPNLWPNYQIEIIPESDVLSNYWFTEKTGRCLATGKPFVLLAGQNSLERLRDLGFKTYGDVIDESYDQEFVPGNKIATIIKSLTALYHSPDKEQKIQELYKIAQHNQKLYRYKHDKSKI